MTLVILQLGISAHTFLILTFVLVMLGVAITLYLTYLSLDSDVHSPAIAQDDNDETGV